MKSGFDWSDMNATPFFPGIWPKEQLPQVSSSYDIGKWWGQPQLFWSLDPLFSQLYSGILKQPLLQLSKGPQVLQLGGQIVLRSCSYIQSTSWTFETEKILLPSRDMAILVNGVLKSIRLRKAAVNRKLTGCTLTVVEGLPNHLAQPNLVCGSSIPRSNCQTHFGIFFAKASW